MLETEVKAVLFDLDGVLYVGDEAIEGAAEALSRVAGQGRLMAGLTNTTTMARRLVVGKLDHLGLSALGERIYTPAALARRHIDGHSARLYVRDALAEDFAAVRLADERPDFVVMGDIGGEGYPPETLREIFLHVMDGSRLLALHKNRFWQRPDGLHLDLGCFVAAVEYATGREATVLGKPSRVFFTTICEALGVEPADCLMVGDDIESDILGAQQAGIRACLVRTGKYRRDFVEASGIEPDHVIDSVADLPDLLASVGG